MTLSMFVLALAVAGDGGASQPAKDQDRMQGEWAITSLLVGARDLVKSDGYEFVTFKGDKSFLTRNGEQAARGSTLTLDATQTPHTIDYAHDGVTVFQGIYKLDGKRLRICYHSTTRPTKFESQAHPDGTYDVLLELERK